MTIRKQKAIFTFSVLWMLGCFILSTVKCPAPMPNELPLVFLFGVASTLIPAFGFLFAARKLLEAQ